MVASKMFHCKLITPEKTLFNGDADYAVMRTIGGDMGVLAGHEPTTTVLGYGLLRIFSGDDERFFAVLGGFARVSEDGCLTILSDDAQSPDEIDFDRAQKTKELNRQRIKDEKVDRVEAEKLEAQIRRAQVRIEVSTYPIIRGRHGE
jgi:F-type H+-transporting ATPase subunit epsilon